jgi:hypothetical protein
VSLEDDVADRLFRIEVRQYILGQLRILVVRGDTPAEWEVAAEL